MSRENDEARLLRCNEKYERIANQVKLLDEKTESKDPAAKQEKNSGGEGSSSGSVTVPDNRENLNHVVVEISKFLDDMNGQDTADNDPKPSNP